MPNRLRNEDCRVQIFVDSERLVDLRCRVENWEVSPEVEIESTRYTGEKFDRKREIYRGGNFSFQLHLIRPLGTRVEQKLIDRATGAALFQLDIRITGAFRTGEMERVDLQNCYLEGPQLSGSGSDLVALALTGKCDIIAYS